MSTPADVHGAEKNNNVNPPMWQNMLVIVMGFAFFIGLGCMIRYTFFNGSDTTSPSTSSNHSTRVKSISTINVYKDTKVEGSHTYILPDEGQSFNTAEAYHYWNATEGRVKFVANGSSYYLENNNWVGAGMPSSTQIYTIYPDGGHSITFTLKTN